MHRRRLSLHCDRDPLALFTACAWAAWLGDPAEQFRRHDFAIARASRSHITTAAFTRPANMDDLYDEYALSTY